MSFIIRREGEEIKDSAGEVIAKEMIDIAEIKITKVEKKYSIFL